VFTNEDKSDIPTPQGQRFPPMDDIQISPAGVRSLLRKINEHKACGPDNLPARILKELADEITQFLTKIFQKTIDTGELPLDWKSGNVTAVYKKCERYTPGNYRQIALTSLCCKIQEHILVSSILNHLDAHDILVDCQHGFRSRRSCETQIITLERPRKR
jgi:hypothetical protein